MLFELCYLCHVHSNVSQFRSCSVNLSVHNVDTYSCTCRVLCLFLRLWVLHSTSQFLQISSCRILLCFDCQSLTILMWISSTLAESYTSANSSTHILTYTCEFSSSGFEYVMPFRVLGDTYPCTCRVLRLFLRLWVLQFSQISSCCRVLFCTCRTLTICFHVIPKQLSCYIPFLDG